ncbi:hypothetical protein ACIPZC_06865 [Pseudomonas sp. NPDC089743]|uniref:hypothetical protein n=1 Tax=Pseudomonas sp. NPDC089743 TaxID=3364471 RepID=UPI003809FF8B
MNLKECFLALERLLAGKPNKIVGAYKINNDTVALEAGFPRGSIKKYNSTHKLLIEDIRRHHGKSFNKSNSVKDQLNKKKEEIKKLEKELNDSLAREALMIKRIIELESSLRLNSNVHPIR